MLSGSCGYGRGGRTRLGCVTLGRFCQSRLQRPIVRWIGGWIGIWYVTDAVEPKERIRLVEPCLHFITFDKPCTSTRHLLRQCFCVHLLVIHFRKPFKDFSFVLHCYSLLVYNLYCSTLKQMPLTSLFLFPLHPRCLQFNLNAFDICPGLLHNRSMT